jgi:TrmH family RNA methyltransferase
MITSIHNPKIKYIRSLLNRRRDRKEAQAFVLEGVRLVEEAFIARWQPQMVLHSQHISKRGEEVLQHFASQGVEIEEISEEIMEKISDTETSQGLIAVFDVITLPLPQNLENILVLDGVRDPGNMGTILRTAAAGGMQAVLLTPGSVDIFSPKVLRAGMGAHFHLPIQTMPWDEIHHLLKIKSNPAVMLYVSVVKGGKPYWDMDFYRPSALVIGGEAEGISYEPQKWADGFVNIPMPGSSESLNAAVAAGIIIFEIIRQRSQ